MKRKLVALVACLVLLVGCSLHPARSAAKANLKNWKVVGPAYVKYLDADKKASASTVKIRKATVKIALELAAKMVESSR